MADNKMGKATVGRKISNMGKGVTIKGSCQWKGRKTLEGGSVTKRKEG